MALVYCTLNTHFLDAFVRWQNKLEGSSGGRHFISDVLESFLFDSESSKDLVHHHLVSFEVELFIHLFDQWIEAALKANPDKKEPINNNARYILEFINDEIFVINNGLVVFECLSDRQKGLKEKNG